MEDVFKEQRRYFETGITRPIAFRKEQLQKLRRLILQNEQPILAALQSDLQKSRFEGYVTEIGMVLQEISHTLRHLGRWARPQRVKTPLAHFPARSTILREPLGVVLILSPWNYPFQLALAPLVGALAAGNCAVIKPSEHSPATSALLQQLTATAFEPGLVAVVSGGVEESQQLLQLPFNHIFFTGSSAVGKVVMAAAAQQLTPVTLELGGKSPCIVDRTAPLSLTAKRIVWGKFLNAGQTCVAPDYLLVERGIREPLLREIALQLQQLYGAEPLHSPDYPRMIHRRAFDRQMELMSGGTIALGGESDAEQLRIAPTVIIEPDLQSPLMQEEIFGPLLPIVEYDQLDQVVQMVASRPKPLALYLFTAKKKTAQQLLERLSFGGGCLNDTIVHLATTELPFGGVGASGMGRYHGRWSFETFSHQKSIMKRGTWLDLPLRYPPANESKLRWIKRFLK